MAWRGIKPLEGLGHWCCTSGGRSSKADRLVSDWKGIRERRGSLKTTARASAAVVNEDRHLRTQL